MRAVTALVLAASAVLLKLSTQAEVVATNLIGEVGSLPSNTKSVFSPRSSTIRIGTSSSAQSLDVSTGQLTSLTDGVSITGITGDAFGYVFFADSTCRIRKVDNYGTVRTLAGTGTCSQSPDLSTTGTSTSLGTLHALYLDQSLTSDSYLYFTEYSRDVVRRINPYGWSVDDDKIWTYAGSVTSSSMRGFAGDGGKATDALLNYPKAMTMDGSGNLYIADSGNDCIRQVMKSTGIITSISHPLFSSIVSLAMDSNGRLYSTSSANAYVARTVYDTASVEVYVGTGTNNGNALAGGDALTTSIATSSLLTVYDQTLYIAMPTTNRMLSVSTNGTGSAIAMTTQSPSRAPSIAPLTLAPTGAPAIAITNSPDTYSSGSHTRICPTYTSSAGAEVTCSFNICGSFVVTATTCSNTYSGDTMLVFRSWGEEDMPSAFNDDNGDGRLCSTVVSPVMYARIWTGCDSYEIVQKCYAQGTCSGTTTYTVAMTDGDDDSGSSSVNSVELSIIIIVFIVVFCCCCCGSIGYSIYACCHKQAPTDTIPSSQPSYVVPGSVPGGGASGGGKGEVQLVSSSHPQYVFSSNQASNTQTLGHTYVPATVSATPTYVPATVSVTPTYVPASASAAPTYSFGSNGQMFASGMSAHPYGALTAHTTV